MPAPAVPPGYRPVARHRRTRRMRAGVEAVGRAGSLVTLAAMLVLAATAGALVDGEPAGGATVSATFGR